MTMVNYAVLLHQVDRVDEAEIIYNQALTGYRKSVGNEKYKI